MSRTKWDIVPKKNVWGLREKDSAWSRRIKKGDVLVFAVTGTSPIVFAGVFEVAEDWYRDKEKLWLDEVQRDGLLTPPTQN